MSMAGSHARDVSAPHLTKRALLIHGNSAREKKSGKNGGGVSPGSQSVRQPDSELID